MEEKAMTNKRNWLGLLAIVLIFGMTVVGCDIPSDEDEVNGYTLNFKVQCDPYTFFNENSGAITKIEFLNGSNVEATVLATKEVNLKIGQSSIYEISGFTEKTNSLSFTNDNYDIDKERVFGVRIIITKSDGTEIIGFRSSSRINNAKILVDVWGINAMMNFYSW
jgi:hypothetical protein